MSTAASDPTPVPAASVPDEAVRLALELAFGVALLGSRQRPPLPIPAGLRPFLRFQKLPPAALAPLRRAIEADEPFRSRVAAVADESVVGRAGALWLRRPDGWEDELAALVAPPDDGADERRDRDAVRVERAERAAARAAAEAAVLAEALAAERERQVAELAEARTKVAESAAGVAERVEAAERAAAAAALAREVAERRLVDAERTRVAADRRAADLADRLAAVEAERAELTSRAEAAERRAAEAERAASAPPPPAPSDLARRVAPLVGEASAAVAELARVLARLGAELDPPRPAPSLRRPAGPGPAAPARPVAPPTAGTRPPAPAPGRAPVSLPPRVAADSAEAAAFLLRRPGALVLVDGYNVAKLAFPGAPTIADERDWLADVVDELAARACADVRVVFDGAGVPPVPSRRRAVQVLFSPAGVTADDVIVDLTKGTPLDRPVVVATNDLALRERVKAYGANVVGSEQLLAAARR